MQVIQTKVSPLGQGHVVCSSSSLVVSLGVLFFCCSDGASIAEILVLPIFPPVCKLVRSMAQDFVGCSFLVETEMETLFTTVKRLYNFSYC